MDTEEDIEIKEAERLGKVQTDEGPYYHEPWWESYKGSVKGKLGGLIIGALVGALIGTGAAFILPLIGAIEIASGYGALSIIGAAAAMGMAYGLHEFSDIGKIVGSNAATAEKQEKRLKEFEAGKFAEIKQEIRDLKAALTGKKEAAAARRQEETDSADIPEHSRKYRDDRGGHFEDYRTKHCDDEHCPPAGGKWVFWKIALIGLIVGAGAGSVLAWGGGATALLHLLGDGVIVAKEGTGLYAAAMGVGGLIGASFGINRDMFRQVFDKTDLWFKGIVKNGKTRSRQIAAQVSAYMHRENGHDKEQNAGHAEPARVATVTAPAAYEGYMDYPASSTYHRDKVLAAAEKALLSFDHTRATPQ